MNESSKHNVITIMGNYYGNLLPMINRELEKVYETTVLGIG